MYQNTSCDPCDSHGDARVPYPAERSTVLAYSFVVATLPQDFDQSIITFRLDLKPGDVVIESGTGSGVMSSVSLKLARAANALFRAQDCVLIARIWCSRGVGGGRTKCVTNIARSPLPGAFL